MTKTVVRLGLTGLAMLITGLSGCLYARQASGGAIWQMGQSGDAPERVGSLWPVVISPSMALLAMLWAAFAYRRRLKEKSGWAPLDREDMALLRTARDALKLFLGKPRRISGSFFSGKRSP